MSRVDEALRRAQRTPAAKGAERDPVAAPADPSVFEAPWDLGDEAQERRANVTVPDTATTAAHRSPTVASAMATPAVPPADAHAPDAAREPLLGREGERALVPAPMNPAIAERLVTGASARTAALTEQFRRLAAVLHHAQIERGVRTVMISSAVAGEGKTLSATNLALTLSESYQRQVLLVDADLRRPTLHDVFQVQNLGGLHEGLKATADTKLAILQISARLALLPAGRPTADPMSLLTSDRMLRILEEAKQAFDFVIVDTPPVGLLTDANLLAAMLDATLLVVRAGETPYALVQRATELVGRERVLGVVLNAAEDPLQWRRYYAYDRYYADAESRR